MTPAPWRFSGESLSVAGLRVSAKIGVTPAERDQPQPLEISLTLPLSFQRAAETDRLADTLDYAAVARETETFLAGRSFHLLETLCRALALHLAQTFGLEEIQLEVVKPGALPQAQGAAARLTLSRREAP
ncbi:MAG: dihydroneopterin aldolase [Deltaproteobacteria bacterium]|nr:dihydroneopterin aldolase [Deltaproteobacteria bacterium]